MVTKVTRDVFDGVVRPILNIDINGGTIDNTPIGVSVRNLGYFTNIEADTLVLSNNLRLPNGSVSTPSLTFAADTNTGIYRVSEDNMGVAVGGVLSASFTTLGMSIPDGTVLNPSLNFLNELNTGFYRGAPNSLGVTINGSSQLVITNAGTYTGNIYPIGNGLYEIGTNSNRYLRVVSAFFDADTGNVAAPTFRFIGANTTGFYAGGSNNVGTSCGGIMQRMDYQNLSIVRYQAAILGAVGTDGNQWIGSGAGYSSNIYFGNYDVATGATSTLTRWTIRKNSTPESGANAGSNFDILRYSDTGAFLGNPIQILRSTGVVNFEQMPTVGGVPIVTSTTVTQGSII